MLPLDRHYRGFLSRHRRRLASCPHVDGSPHAYRVSPCLSRATGQRGVRMLRQSGTSADTLGARRRVSIRPFDVQKFHQRSDRVSSPLLRKCCMLTLRAELAQRVESSPCSVFAVCEMKDVNFAHVGFFLCPLTTLNRKRNVSRSSPPDTEETVSGNDVIVCTPNGKRTPSPRSAVQWRQIPSSLPSLYLSFLHLFALSRAFHLRRHPNPHTPFYRQPKSRRENACQRSQPPVLRTCRLRVRRDRQRW